MPIVATDMTGVREVGLSCWRAERAWPVAEARFHAFVDDVYEAYDEALAALEGLDEVAFLADTTMVSILIAKAHEQVAVALAKRLGWRVQGRQGDVQARTPQAMVTPLRLALQPVRGLSQLLRRPAKRWVFNVHLSPWRRVSALAGQSDAWLVGSRSTQKLAWAAEHDLRIDALDLHTLLDAGGLGEAPPPTKVALAARHVVERAIACAQARFDVEVDLTWLEEAWTARLSCLHGGGQLLQRLRFPGVVLLGEVAKPWSKVVAGVARQGGAHVVADAHGLQVGHVDQRGLAWSECAPLSEYICYNPFHGQAMKRVYASTPIAARRLVPMTSLRGVNAFKAVQRSMAIPRTGCAGRTIMVIGHPMNPTRYVFSCGDFFAVQLALECDMAQALRTAGFRVVYKAHPERREEVEGLVEEAFDAVEFRYLDEVVAEADGFAFGGVTTTALNYALLTDRPVAIMDIEGIRWNPAVRGPLSRRATLVPTGLDDHLRTSFNADDLVGAFESLHGRQDQAYAHECLGLSQSERFC